MSVRAALAVLCLLGGLALSAQAAAQTATTAPTPAYERVAWPAGRAAPVWQASDVNGRVWRSADLRGRKVLLNFWATWCEPCRAEMPALQALAAAHPQWLVLTLNLKESVPVVQQFAQRGGLTLPLLRDADGSVARAWGVRIYPTSVWLSPEGKVLGMVRGEVDWAGTEAQRWLGL